MAQKYVYEGHHLEGLPQTHGVGQYAAVARNVAVTGQIFDDVVVEETNPANLLKVKAFWKSIREGNRVDK